MPTPPISFAHRSHSSWRKRIRLRIARRNGAGRGLEDGVAGAGNPRSGRQLRGDLAVRRRRCWSSAMVVVGGATRLTGSGLSITEWKPVTGAMPPLSRRRTGRGEFAALPGHPAVPAGQPRHDAGGVQVDLLVGVDAPAARPAGGRGVRRALRRPSWRCGGFRSRLIWRCVDPARAWAACRAWSAGGWWQSGLEDRVSVAPERLATHLGLALILLCRADLDRRSTPGRRSRRGQRAARTWRLAGRRDLCWSLVFCPVPAGRAGGRQPGRA